MHWCDERLAEEPGADASCETLAAGFEAIFETMALSDLVRGWREANCTDLRGRTPGCRAFLDYFDRIGRDSPDRAFAFIEAIAADEPDDALLALIAEEKLLGQLLHFHGTRLARDFQIAALRNPRLRWLMGGIAWALHGGMVANADAKRRLLTIADQSGYQAWRQRLKTETETIDFAALPLDALARAWVEIKNRSNRDRLRDDKADDLFEFEGELVSDPLGALDLVKAVLAIEDDPSLLGLLSAGLLEALLPTEDGPIVDAVVAEAEVDPRFRALLRGVWFTDLSPPVVARLARASLQA
jgi:hypothetical protein